MTLRVGADDAGRVVVEVADRRRHRDIERFLHRDELRQRFSKLDDRERGILAAHYGLNDNAHTPETYATAKLRAEW